MNKIWFPAKRYGVGWGLPVAWQGWVVFIVYFILLFTGGYFLATSPATAVFFIMYVMVLSALLILICWKKGEKIEFRWGNKTQK